MSATERQFTTNTCGESLGFCAGDGVAVETRFHYQGFEGDRGRFELRDHASFPVLAGDVASALAEVPCFTASTLVASGKGVCAVGDLTPGARVITRDNGMQEVRWIGRRSFGWRALGLNPLVRPVRIAAGALGQGVPERDMVVSPNHRFLTTLPGEGETGERLCMARDLLGLDGVTSDTCTHVEYWQILFDRHELVLSDGCWSESFQPTAAALAALDGAGRESFEAAWRAQEQTDPVPEFAPVRPFVAARMAG